MTREEAINMLYGIRADNLNLDDVYTKDKYDALTMAIKALEQTRWIPVSERLPKEKENVLIFCDDYYLKNLNPCIGWRNGNYWYTFTAKGCESILYPVAWMPLPPSYQGK